METVVIQINNSKAYKLLETLEDMQVIKVLKKNFQSQQKLSGNNIELDSARRLKEIQSITKDIHIDLSNFRFNRDEANNYDS
jgi:hypothetical protein